MYICHSSIVARRCARTEIARLSACTGKHRRDLASLYLRRDARIHSPDLFTATNAPDTAQSEADVGFMGECVASAAAASVAGS